MQIDSILQFLQDHIPTMEQLIQLLDVIIWPSLLFLVILLLREPIKALLPLVEDISYKDFKIRFFFEYLHIVNKKHKRLKFLK